MHDTANLFLWWSFLRAVCHRGYVLVSGLYFVIDAQLSASQLVVLGTVMSVTLLLADIPVGIWADTSSRKWTLVAGHAFLAAGMIVTGLVTAFPLILITQVLWGTRWAFWSGADVAWVTDELDQPERITRVLAAQARWGLLGGATGMIAFGVLSWTTGLATAIVVSGVIMALLGVLVAARFTETNFTPTTEQRWHAARAIFEQGIALARHDHDIRLMLASTLIINGASMVAWLFPKQLVDVGFPNYPVLWYTALGILAAAVGAIALRIVEAHIDGVGFARRLYALACFIGVVGMLLLAFAPNALIGSVGVLLITGIAFSVTRAISVIWVNRRTRSEMRATVHSFLSQAESVGEIVSGFALAILAGAAGSAATLVSAGALMALTGVIVARARVDRVTPAPTAG